MKEKIPAHQKRIDESYRWKNPTIVDRHPEMIELLKTKPLYVDALYTRKILLKKMDWEVQSRRASEGKPKRPTLNLFNLKEPAPHLNLVK